MKSLPIAFCIALSASPAFAFETVAVLSGTGQVIDGDGILFGDVEVRLQGIAAPEDNSHGTEAGGAVSTANLQRLVNGNLVVCHLDGSTAGQRPVGICFVNGVEANLHQVETGHARDCPAFSSGRYQVAELRSRQAGQDLSKVYDLPNYCK